MSGRLLALSLAVSILVAAGQDGSATPRRARLRVQPPAATIAPPAPRSAPADLTQVIYPVADLVIPLRTVVEGFRPLPERSPGLAPTERGMAPWVKSGHGFAPTETVEHFLIDLITSTVAPASWSAQGGPGQIQYYPLGMSMVVAAAPAVQEEVRDLLNALRRLQDISVALELRILKVHPEALARAVEALELRPTPRKDLETVRATETGLRLVHPRGEAWLAELDPQKTTALLESLQAHADTMLMQAPKQTLFNGQRSLLEIVGSETFATSVEVYSDGMVAPRSTAYLHGTRFLAAPVVSADHRSVRVDLEASIAELVGNTPQVAVQVPIKREGGKDETFQMFVQRPEFSRVHVKPRVTVADGATALMHCGVVPAEVRRESCHPLLKDIPVLNELFTQVGYAREDRSILIMLSPRVIIASERQVQPDLGRLVPR